MDSTKSHYVKTEGENKFIEVNVYYSLGGMSWATNKPEKRGMYLYVTPVELSDNCKITGAFKGYKTLLKKMKRKNKKELEYAEGWVEKHYEAIAKKFMSVHDADWDIIDSYGD